MTGAVARGGAWLTYAGKIQTSGAALASDGIGCATNSRRQGLAMRRAHRFARFTRALSVAMPVLAYICR